MSKTAFAGALGISRRTLYDLLDQQQAVSAAMAIRRETVLGSSAEFCINLQSAHDLWSVRTSVNTAQLWRLAGHV